MVACSKSSIRVGDVLAHVVAEVVYLGSESENLGRQRDHGSDDDASDRKRDGNRPAGHAVSVSSACVDVANGAVGGPPSGS